MEKLFIFERLVVGFVVVARLNVRRNRQHIQGNEGIVRSVIVVQTASFIHS
jgi:hypothetical protein